MKLIKSTIKRDKPIGELPHGKVTITMEGPEAMLGMLLMGAMLRGEDSDE